MTVEIMSVVSVVSIAFGIAMSWAGWKRNHRADSAKDASEMTAVIVKLENIGAGITEIKAELTGVKEDISGFRERVAIMEQSIKSAWKQIDEMKGVH